MSLGSGSGPNLFCRRNPADASPMSFSPVCRRARLVGIAMLLGAFVLNGCSEDVRPSSSNVIELLSEEPSATFKSTYLTEYRAVFSWSFEGHGALAPWTSRNLVRPLEIEAGQLVVSAATRDPILVRNTEIEAASVDAIEVVFDKEPRNVVQFFWARQGEPFAPERSVSWHPGETPAPVIFDLTTHPAWKGTVEQIRLDPTNRAGETLRISSIRFLRKSLRPEALGEITSTSWRVDLDHEIRNAVFVPPTKGISRQIAPIPHDAELHFSYGIWSEVPDPSKGPGPIEWIFSLQPRSRTPVELLRLQLDPNDPRQSRHWHEAYIDLSKYGGQDATLLVETRAPETEPLRVLPLWANPEVVSRGQVLPHVILVSLDTLRADHLSLYGYERNTSPNLDAWARNWGIVFDQVVAQASTTLPSHASLLTGMSAVSHGVNHGLPAPENLTTIAEIMGALGYETVAITGGGFLDPQYALDQGFDVYRYRRLGNLFDEREIEDHMDRALEFLGEHRKRPLFLFFHTYEIHSPFRAREPYFSHFGGSDARDADAVVNVSPRRRRAETGFLTEKELLWYEPGKEDTNQRVEESELAEVIKRYDSGIAYADAQLGRLFKRLREKGFRERALLVITSDHGTSFGEHQKISHGHLYDDNLLVPLVVGLPGGIDAGKRVGQQSRLIDVAATILDYIGQQPASSVEGRSLRSAIEGRNEGADPPIASTYMPNTNYGLSLRIDGRLKYIFNNTAWPPVRYDQELYSVIEDAREERNLARQEDERLTSLREEAKRQLDQRGGLRILFRNNENHEYQGLIEGSIVKPSSVKTHTMGCDCAAWAPPEGIRFSISAKEEFSLIVEEVQPAEITIRIDASGLRVESGFEGTLDLADLGKGRVWSVEFDGRAWTSAGSREIDTGIVIEWKGAAPMSGSSPTQRDENLRRQLEALGYVR